MCVYKCVWSGLGFSIRYIKLGIKEHVVNGQLPSKIELPWQTAANETDTTYDFVQQNMKSWKATDVSVYPLLQDRLATNLLHPSWFPAVWV